MRKHIALWLLLTVLVAGVAGSIGAYVAGLHQGAANSVTAYHDGRSQGWTDNRVTEKDRRAFDQCMAYYMGRAKVALNPDGCFGDTVMSWQR